MTPDVASGQVTGGWDYVVLSYGLSWVIFGLYTFYLWFRGREVNP